MQRAQNKYSKPRARAGGNRRGWVAAFIVVSAFVLANIGVAAVYRQRTYPRTTIMNTSIGSVPYNALSQTVSNRNVLPEEVTLKRDDHKVRVSLAALGITQQIERTTSSAVEQRYWLPVVKLFRIVHLEAPVAVNDRILTAESGRLGAQLSEEATEAHLQIKGSTVSIVGGVSGRVIDQARLKESILAGLDQGKTEITVATKTVNPRTTAASLKSEQQRIQARIHTKLSFSYNGSIKRPSAADIAGWLTPSGNTYTISDDQVNGYVASLNVLYDIHIKDGTKLVDTIINDVKTHTNHDITVTSQTPVKTLHYCTDVRGESAANLIALQEKLRRTYADPRGWSLNGLIDFRPATSNCDFTVWISAASQMTSFGGVCDAIWSCRIGTSVVFNYDRWSNASPAWNKTGKSLDEYRSMLVNHESGHFLGFGHLHCTSPGAPAPLMQQQSINLEGCVFNAWPTQPELDTLKRSLGV